MIRFFISLVFLLSTFCICAEELFVVRVWLSDKEGCKFSTLRPEEFLSERSIERRKRDNIEICSNDLPISEQYKSKVMSIAHRLLCHSKWLNTLVVECNTEDIDKIKALPFVKQVEVVSPKEIERREFKSEFFNAGNIKRHSLYGVTHQTAKSANVTKLHKKGYWGKGAYIAVLDDGFGGVDTLTQWFDRERIKFDYDVINPNGNIYREDEHGTAVLSIMLANREGEFVGVAPQSDYALIRTEDIEIEVAYEEDFWVRGVEIADSLGVDIINSSLGYEQFGDITSVSCLAAEIATKKGIAVVTSCGNKGEEGYTHPANVKGVIAVGGIDKRGKLIDFTSKEFIDGEFVAPKVVALGEDVVAVDGKGGIVTCYGTSFAAPAISGKMALELEKKCLK